jgi:hypothetical protein
MLALLVLKYSKRTMNLLSQADFRADMFGGGSQHCLLVDNYKVRPKEAQFP